MGPEKITSTTCHCNNTLRFSVFFISILLLLKTCVCAWEMMIIINIYCLHTVVYDDSSGFMCIFLTFQHTKEIRLLHLNVRLFFLSFFFCDMYSRMYLNFVDVCFNSIMTYYILVFHLLIRTMSPCIVWVLWVVLRLEF